VVEIPGDHFGMTHFSDKTATEHQIIMNLLERASDKARGKGHGEGFILPSQPGPSNQSISKTQTPHYDLQYWLIRPETPKPTTLEVGHVVHLVAETKPRSKKSDVETTAKLGPILVANQIKRLEGTKVKANASMELRDDRSVRMVKHAAQKGLFPTSFEVLRIWKTFAKRRFPKPDLKFGTIRVEMWEANDTTLDAARKHVSENKTQPLPL